MIINPKKPAPLTYAWFAALSDVLYNGRTVCPRGQTTWEIPHRTLVVDMLHPVLLLPERKLSYQFMAAEAAWILSGDDTVGGISPWNKHIAQFSDNGLTFDGAYGPKIVSQLDYVVKKLLEDRDSRQAGLTIWKPNPAPSKDIPCTVAIWFQIRDKILQCHVFMRSSDVWLGLPYDTFSFSMLACLVAGSLNKQLPLADQVKPGTLWLTAASSHLYQKNHGEAMALVREYQTNPKPFGDVELPTELYTDPTALLERLCALRDTVKGDPLRWWEQA